MLQQCPICYENTRCNALLGCNHVLCDPCKENIKRMPGKTRMVEEIPCIECPICRSVELPPYQHITGLLRESRAREVEYRQKLDERMTQVLTSQLEYMELKHRFKLKIRRETQQQNAAPVPKTKASEPCDTCLRKTPRICNVYGCRKHCCMNCVICKECEQIMDSRQQATTITL